MVLYLQHHPRDPAEIDVPKFILDETLKYALPHALHVSDLVNYGIVKNAKT